MASIASDPVPGAVLELPLAHLDTEGERRLLGQLIHQRPTTVLARNMVVRGQPRLERLERFQEQLVAFRGQVEGLSFVYRAPGFQGADRLYLIRRGRIRRELAHLAAKGDARARLDSKRRRRRQGKEYRTIKRFKRRQRG